MSAGCLGRRSQVREVGRRRPGGVQSRDEATQVGEGRRAGLEPLEQQRVVVVAGVEQLHRCTGIVPEAQRGGSVASPSMRGLSLSTTG